MLQIGFSFSNGYKKWFPEISPQVGKIKKIIFSYDPEVLPDVGFPMQSLSLLLWMPHRFQILSDYMTNRSRGFSQSESSTPRTDSRQAAILVLSIYVLVGSRWTGKQGTELVSRNIQGKWSMRPFFLHICIGKLRISRPIPGMWYLSMI